MSGAVHWEEFEDYIYLGHELVHAWREDRGIDVPSGNPDGYYAYGNVREEELQTSGINYNDSSGNPIRQYTTYNGIISENGLRLENSKIKSVRVQYTP